MNSYLPVIDIASTLSGDRAAIAKVAGELNAVCRKNGFFYIVGHGVPQSLIDRVFAVAQEFFAHSDDEKRTVHSSQSPLRRGYDLLGHQSLDRGKPPDLIEGFNIGLDSIDGDPPTPRRGPNQWPADAMAPGFERTVVEYLAAMEAASRHLMGLLAVALNLPQSYFDDVMTCPVPTLRLLHYPPQDAMSDLEQMKCGAHTDWGAITLLAQDANGGLQVQDAEGAWHDVPPVAGSFVVNLGDMMARWTNDIWRSTMHRVINRIGGQSRYSLPYFFDIDHHSVVSALPGCFSEARPPRYPPVTAGEHHQEKLRQARDGYS